MSPRQESTRCPLCDGAAYVWISVPPATSGASVGMISPVDPSESGADAKARIFDRCDTCGSGIERGSESPDLKAELAGITARDDDGALVLDAPNRASLQAGMGGDAWAALLDSPNRLLLTPRGLELLAERTGVELERPAFPPSGRNQRWMWQTVLNGITVHPNFATRMRRGALHRRNARGWFSFTADLAASLLATPLVLLVSVPLEALAALFGRGGRMVTRARRG